MADIDYEIVQVLSAIELRQAAFDWAGEEDALGARMGDEPGKLAEPASSRAHSSDGYNCVLFPDYLGQEELEFCQIPSFTADGPPPWAIALSKQFKKDAAALDRKMLGKAFEVLAEITDFTLPFQPRGDTFKALSGNMEGCWRYRIGDWRLVIKPNRTTSQIVALALASRGSVYD